MLYYQLTGIILFSLMIFFTTHWVLTFEYILCIGFSLDLLKKKSVFLILNGIIFFILLCFFWHLK